MSERRQPAELREREHDRLDRSVLKRPLKAPFSFKVVGVSFTPGYPDNLMQLNAAQQEALAKGEPLKAIVVRNPKNEHDPNAVQVHVPALGEEWGFIGHMTSPLARRLAPQLDNGEEWSGAVFDVLIHPDHPDRPGISIHLKPHHPEEQ